jgi:hypothetical protein
MGIAQVRDEVMPALLGIEGCVGLSMLVDRQAGRCIATSAWQSREAMLASEDLLRPMRDRVAEVLGGKPQVEQWEIAVLHRDHTSGQVPVFVPPGCVSELLKSIAPSMSTG